MRLARFNELGLDYFRKYLGLLRQDPKASPPMHLLTSGEYSDDLPEPIDAEPRPFSNRLEFAEWLHDAAEAAGTAVPRDDVNFWAWLSLALFDQVCPVDGNERRKVGAQARYIPDTANWRRRYRHLLANPFDVLSVHFPNHQRALVALVNPLDKPGELSEQFGSRVEIINCPGSIGLATYLYIDPQTRERRKGASGEAARRFGKLMNQYTRTFDLPEMESGVFASILPKEFDRFTKAAASQADGVAP